MARHIDDSKPLSDDDRKWLQDWSRNAEIERIDALHGTQPEDYNGGTLFDNLKPLQGGDDASGEPEEPEDPLKGEQNASAQQAAAREAEGDGAPEDWNVETDDEPYDDWTKDDLQDELETRGLTKSGNKDDLIDRLRESDA